MPQTPNLSEIISHASFSFTTLLQSPVLFVSAGLILLMVLSSIFRMARALFALVAAGSALWILYDIASTINHTIGGSSKTGWITLPSIVSSGKISSIPIIKTQTLNVGAIVALLIVALVILIFYGAVKSSGYSMGYVFNRFKVYFLDPIDKKNRKDMYDFPDVTIGIGIGEAQPGLPGDREKAGKRIEIKKKDRFLNMGIIGPIGSGKTFMTMKPQIYHDLEHIAQGTMTNVIWISPQPEPAVERYAESLGITVRRIHIIDGQVGDGKGTNIRFNPLAGDQIDSVISNVNIILNEQTGDKAKGAAFFDDMAAQATTDSLQLYKYLYGFDSVGHPVEIDIIGWYDHYLVQMDALFYDATRVLQVSELEEQDRQMDLPFSEARIEWIYKIVWPKLSHAEKVMLRRAAFSIISEFGGDVEGKNAEAYKNIIRGLRGKVRVLISSQYVQELLGNDQVKDRPNFSFESWIDPPEWISPTWETPFPHGNWFSNIMHSFKYKKYVVEQMEFWKKEATIKRKGELLSVITGQTETGKLVGRMVLVFEQQAVLNRPGKDNDKPPVYAYVDEYPSYATRSINEIRTQGRKHCHSMVMAMQSRAQMEEIGRGYQKTMEGSTRHWVYLSNLGFEDAQDVEKMSGKVKRIKIGKSTRQVRMGGLGKDDGNPLVTKSEQEEMVYRFSADFIQYGLGKNEVIYKGVDDRQGKQPLRMRIVEPRENKVLVKKLSTSPSIRPTKERSPKISTYPSREIVAQVKWPIMTLGHQTLYVYRWGMKIERDAYVDKKSVDAYEPFDASFSSEPVKLLKDIFDGKHEKENEASEEIDEIARRRSRIRTTFGKSKIDKEKPVDQAQIADSDAPADESKQPEKTLRRCKYDGTPLKEKVDGDSVIYVCPTCSRTYH